MNKICTMAQAIESIPDGAMVAIGGNTLNRVPMEAVYQMARQNKRNLQLVKTAGAMDIDLLCLAGCVKSVDAGYVSYESQFSLCRYYRQAVEKGQVITYEHACYTVICALRAAAYGIPFMPVKGLGQTQLMESNPRLGHIQDPFGGPDIAVVQAIRPDFAILHVHYADQVGNAMICGPVYEDLLMVQASERVIITTEEIVPDNYFRRQDVKAQIPAFQVEAVVHAPKGARPTAMPFCYPVDEAEVRAFQGLGAAEQLSKYLEGRREAAR